MTDKEEQAEQQLNALANKPGVMGFSVLDKKGNTLKHNFKCGQTMDDYKAIKIGGLFSDFLEKTKNKLSAANESVSNANRLNLSSEIDSIRLRTEKYEIIIVPAENHTLIILQDPNAIETKAIEEVQTETTPTEGDENTGENGDDKELSTEEVLKATDSEKQSMQASSSPSNNNTTSTSTSTNTTTTNNNNNNTTNNNNVSGSGSGNNNNSNTASTTTSAAKS
eukprot:TRINITY_DN11596_c0_g1_i1.p1 TRINITY_DN11596_c0_g1~~TRINITY_DN11596_c0_g1_i1.p1  ORF type:complete len:223 (-),score=62.11 TRINITY_DN11596_c0_g1_i1:71-739(-)